LKFPEFKEDGGCSNWTQFVDDHALEVDFHSTDNICSAHTVTDDGIEYELLQMHFHSPSEHTVGGGYTDAEIHMVHKSIDGKYLVVGIFLNAMASSMRGANNVILKKIWKAAADVATPAATGDDDMTVSIEAAYQIVVKNSTSAMKVYSSLLPASRDYYTYMGSLTTYPCTEGIKFVIMKEPVAVSNGDIKRTRKAVSMYPNSIVNSFLNDNRPTQPQNDRTVKYYTDIGYNPNPLGLVNPPGKYTSGAVHLHGRILNLCTIISLSILFRFQF
jgi:carbonic anhydrase